MYTALYQYLLQHKELLMPGIGTFSLEREPAVVDFSNKRINPPSYSISFATSSHSPNKSFFTWLSQALGISDREAIFRFNDFAFDMKKQVSAGDTIVWNGLGKINKGLAGDIKFAPEGILVVGEPVIAEKVIREKAEHSVRVGEDHRTSAEMTEILTQTEQKKSYWWAWALGIALLAVMFIGYYFSEHGVNMETISNDSKLVPMEATTGYQLVP